MPTVAEVQGVKIIVNRRDHLPPHFHAKKNGVNVFVVIETHRGSRCARTALPE